MNTQTQKNIRRIMTVAAVLVVIGGGLNILVLETPESFDLASVILVLFVGFWALMLGTLTLIPSLIWLSISRKHSSSEPIRGQPEAEAHRPIVLQAVGHRRMCHT